MAKDWARKFYDSGRWRNTRRAYVSRRQSIDGGLCERCRQELGLMVHHIKELTPENMHTPIACDPANLEYLCKPCHDREPGHYHNSAKGPIKFVFDDRGYPVEVGRKQGK